jgi:hypothetical protein
MRSADDSYGTASSAASSRRAQRPGAGLELQRMELSSIAKAE